jgi:hypothetical protein
MSFNLDLPVISGTAPALELFHPQYDFNRFELLCDLYDKHGENYTLQKMIANNAEFYGVDKVTIETEGIGASITRFFKNIWATLLHALREASRIISELFRGNMKQTAISRANRAGQKIGNAFNAGGTSDMLQRYRDTRVWLVKDNYIDDFIKVVQDISTKINRFVETYFTNSGLINFAKLTNNPLDEFGNWFTVNINKYFDKKNNANVPDPNESTKNMVRDLHAINNHNTPVDDNKFKQVPLMGVFIRGLPNLILPGDKRNRQFDEVTALRQSFDRSYDVANRVGLNALDEISKARKLQQLQQCVNYIIAWSNNCRKSITLIGEAIAAECLIVDREVTRVSVLT